MGRYPPICAGTGVRWIAVNDAQYWVILELLVVPQFSGLIDPAMSMFHSRTEESPAANGAMVASRSRAMTLR